MTATDIKIWRTEDLRTVAAEHEWKLLDPRDLMLDDMREAEAILRAGLTAIGYTHKEEWVADFPNETTRVVFVVPQ